MEDARRVGGGHRAGDAAHQGQAKLQWRPVQTAPLQRPGDKVHPTEFALNEVRLGLEIPFEYTHEIVARAQRLVQ